MNSEHVLREKITDLISEEVGPLAEIMIDEILDDLDIEEVELSRYFATKFISGLEKKLPKDLTNRQHIMHDVGMLLIRG